MIILNMSYNISLKLLRPCFRLPCSNISRSEPLVPSSPFLSPVGSTRTKRMIKSRKPPKFPDLHVDKSFPFKYTFRALPSCLEVPGDRDKTLGFTDKSQYKLYFKDSEELKTASKEVQKIFSLELGTQNDILDFKHEEIRQKIQRYRIDNNSEEMRIARRTLDIRQKFEKLNADPHNPRLRNRLNIIIGKRNNLLKKLRKRDENRFNWLINTLGIDFERPLLGVTIYKPTRTLEITRLTEEYCQKVRTEKLNVYKEKLKAEQAVFVEEKKAALEWIAKEEKAIQEKQEQLKLEEESFWRKKDCRNV